MVELIFVVVVIGILASIAISKIFRQPEMMQLSQRARNTVATVRNAIAMERQKRILRGDFYTCNCIWR